ncbi:GntR family transcriptional regulator [Jeotgalibacillus proteolyticus]|uniref:GntR family transcriptional regulator n=1 Tax=Jeotgalibacillus proteolyticus TaxID=2082395 RepID=A0A2S5GBW1_9BACL|nr:GntR family transcriptional regulator [Jeotgalibacillus proteolyticus]PPA70527.1 GntR family transcriptional regulator [Jeotgalibacillus proteolyticus]
MSISKRKGPLYLQIKNILKDRITHGVYALGENIPPEPQLEKEFDVSKITIRNAISELVQEGYLEKKSGKGTKVIRNMVISKVSKGKRFTEILVGSGHKIYKQLIEAEVVFNKEDTEQYELFGKQCLRIERLYHFNEVPYIHFTHYLTTRMEEMDLEDLDKQSLYGLVEEAGISLENFRDEFAAVIAPSEITKILAMEADTPVLKRMRYAYDEAGNIIENSIGYYNTEMQHYVVNYDI